MSIHTRLRELGLQLPHAAAPVASYQPVVVDGQVIGAVGVGGGTGEQDAEIAKAGIERLLKELR